MLLNNANQPLSWAVPYLLYAAIQFVWIAAFWFPTHFERFRYVPPGKFSYCYFSASVIWMGALFCTFFQKNQDGGCYRCRSPPSDFDFASQLKIEIGGITHEENQSAGLLPVLYKGHSC